MQKNVFNYKGNSMLPLIKPQSQLSIEIVQNNQYHKGDIICFIQYPHQLFAHRLVSFTAINGIKGIIEKGDNVYGYSFVPFNMIIGKVSSIQYNNFSINLSCTYWKLANYILAYIAHFQIMLLKLLPFSYHKDSLLKRIPHYGVKILFRFFLFLSLVIYKKVKSKK